MGPELIILLFAGALVCVLLTGFPVAFVLGGVSIIAALVGAEFGVFDLKTLGGVHQQVFGVMNSRPFLAVPLFVFMGLILERSRIAEELLATMGRLFGSVRGGLAISVCIVGALLAASTGIVGATVVTMGLLSLPTMLRAGYNKELATGTICASGTLGQLIPPSIVLIILGDQMQSAYDKAKRDPSFSCERLTQWSPCENLPTVSVSELFAGAFIPGILLVSLYICYILLIAWLKPAYAPAAKEKGETDPNLWRDVFSSLLPPLFLIVAVLGSILLGVATPTEAAAIGATVAMLIATIKLCDNRIRWIVVSATFSIVLIVGIVSYGRITGAYDLRPTRSDVSGLEWNLIYLLFALIGLFVAGVVCSIAFLSTIRPKNLEGVKSRNPVLFDVMYGTLKISTMVFVILIGARALTTVFIGFHGDMVVKDFLFNLPGGLITQLLVVMLIMFLLGFFLDFIEIAFIVVPIVAPILLLGGVHPVWLGVLFAMNLQTSFLTPPFGFALFYLRGVAPPEVKTIHIYRGVMPFVLIQVIGLVILFYWKSLATWLPSVMF